MASTARLPSPNPKYPFVGPNYNQYGEVPGYLYHPWTDRYYPDPKSQKQVAKDQGVAKKDPSLGSQLLPVAAGVGGAALASEVGKNIPSYLGKGIDAAKNYLGYGEDAAKASTGAANAASSGASTAAQATNKGAGLLSVGSDSALQSPNIVPPSVSNATPVGTAANGGTLLSDGSTLMSDGTVVPASTPTNWGAIAQGGAGALSLVNSYLDAKKGNYVGAGINGATGAAQVGASLGNAAAASAAEILGPIGAVYGGYQTAKSTGEMAAGGRRNSTGAIQGAGAGASAGATIGSIIPGVGTAIGAGIGAVVGGTAGLVGSLYGSSKGGGQMLRDKARDIYEKAGILTKNEKGSHIGTLADGSTYDFGKDGKGFGKREINNPLVDPANGMGDALATIEGFYGKSREPMTIFYRNAALSNAGSNVDTLTANYAHFAKQRGITRESAQQALDKLLGENKITQAQHDSWSQWKDKFTQPGAGATGGVRSQTRSPGIGLDGKPFDYSKAKRGNGLLSAGSK